MGGVISPGVWPGGVWSGGVSGPGGLVLGGVQSRGCLLWGVSGLGCLLRGGGIPACTEADTPPVDRITDAYKNITLAQLRCGQ